METGFIEDGREPLTKTEEEAVRIAGRLYTFISNEVVADGPTREDDLREIASLIHGIQRAILAQAAARLNPEKYRLLGSVIPKKGD